MADGIINEELAYRLEVWSKIKAAGGPNSIHSRLLKELRIAIGQQGIWADKQRTAKFSRYDTGITFSLRSIGESDLGEQCMIYHYPKTKRPGHDEVEIEVKKEAARLQLPVADIKRSSTAECRNN